MKMAMMASAIQKETLDNALKGADSIISRSYILEAQKKKTRRSIGKIAALLVAIAATGYIADIAYGAFNKKKNEVYQEHVLKLSAIKQMYNDRKYYASRECCDALISELDHALFFRNNTLLEETKKAREESTRSLHELERATLTTLQEEFLRAKVYTGNENYSLAKSKIISILGAVSQYETEEGIAFIEEVNKYKKDVLYVRETETNNLIQAVNYQFSQYDMRLSGESIDDMLRLKIESNTISDSLKSRQFAQAYQLQDQSALYAKRLEDRIKELTRKKFEHCKELRYNANELFQKGEYDNAKLVLETLKKELDYMKKNNLERYLQ